MQDFLYQIDRIELFFYFYLKRRELFNYLKLQLQRKQEQQEQRQEQKEGTRSLKKPLDLEDIDQKDIFIFILER